MDSRQPTGKILLNIRKNAGLYILIMFPLTYLFIFKYAPMYGVQIAFKDYNVVKGISGSPWVGLEHFKRFFTSTEFTKLLGNTLILNLYSLLAGFPFPIILAICLNYIRVASFKKTVQMITYLPHFISMTVLVGMIFQLFAMDTGMISHFLQLIGFESTDYMGSAKHFRHIYVWSGVWQQVGYASIIYIATLASVDPQLHEAAIIDGANKFQQVWHIDVPVLMPTAIILFILNTGRMLNVGFEKVYLMQNPLNIRTAEVIDTYVYKVGLKSPLPNFSYPTAIGLFQSLIGVILVYGTNQIAKRMGQESLW